MRLIDIALNGFKNTLDMVSEFLSKRTSFFKSLFSKPDSNKKNTEKRLKRLVKQSVANNVGIEEFNKLVTRQLEIRKKQTLRTMRDLTSESRTQFRGEHASKFVRTWYNFGVFDDRQTALCRAYKGKKWARWEDIDKIDHPPRHSACRSKIFPSSSERDFDISDKEWKDIMEVARLDDMRRLLTKEEFDDYRTTLLEGGLSNIPTPSQFLRTRLSNIKELHEIHNQLINKV